MDFVRSAGSLGLKGKVILCVVLAWFSGVLCWVGVCRCLNGQTECKGACVDTTQSNAHCGACENSCGDRKVCQQSRCACRSDLLECSGDYADINNDDKHCGGCGKSCKSYEACRSGKCECKDPKGFCGGVCVDIATDSKHCGGCDQVCDSNKEQCVGGKCVCASSLVLCDGVCFDTKSAFQHCGKCGVVCGVGEKCEGGRCVPLASIAAGAANTCAISGCGQLKCWGSNGANILGRTSSTTLYWPGWGVVDFGSGQGPQVQQVAVNSSHACAILLEQSMHCWGANDRGQLGYGDKTTRSSPPVGVVSLGAGRTALALALGRDFSCALLDDGSPDPLFLGQEVSLSDQKPRVCGTSANRHHSGDLTKSFPPPKLFCSMQATPTFEERLAAFAEVFRTPLCRANQKERALE